MSAFRPRTVLALVVFGALAFVAMLWFIGRGDTGPGPDNGGAHAQGHGLAGYAGLVAMLEKQGYDVTLSRSSGRLDDESLLVLTPSAFTDPDGHPWEVAHNPRWTIRDDGSIELPA